MITPNQKVAGNVVLALGVPVWATQFLVADILLETWDAYFVTTARLLAAIGFLIAAYLVQSRGRPLAKIPSFAAVQALGAVGMAGYTVCLTLGVKYSGAVTSAIVAISEPIVAAFMACFLFKAPLRLAVLIGAFVAMAGGVFATFGASGGDLSDIRGGEILLLLGLCLFIWYAIGAQHWMVGLSQLGIAAITVTVAGFSMLALLPMLIVTGVAEFRYETDWQSIVFVLYLGVGPASVALFCWHWGVSRCGETVAAIYTNLVPIVVVGICMIEGHATREEQLIGGTLIICGVLIAQLLPAGKPPRLSGEAA